MRYFGVLCCALALLGRARAADSPIAGHPVSAAEIARELANISLDPGQSYRIRDVQLTRGDINIYLTEGVLSFITPVEGRRVAAVFTTEGVEAGDAEILVLPPQRSERALLASFIKSPNMDEHFTSAAFLFSDDTAQEILAQIQQRPIRKASETGTDTAPGFNTAVRNMSAGIEVRLVQSLLDNHPPAKGFFYAAITGGDLGTFDVLYDPVTFEPVTIGRASEAGGEMKFQLWTEFRPRHALAYVRPVPRIRNYRIEASIHPDLSMSVTAAFPFLTEVGDGRTVALQLSARLKVGSAEIDGKPAEVFQRETSRLERVSGAETFLLVPDAALAPGTEHQVEIHYEGSVIRQTGDGGYFVDERNAWYPYTSPTLATFDLTFRCPASLRLVSTGELVSDEIVGSERSVHRETQVAEALAGFNLGDYNVTSEEHGAYRVECYANKLAPEEMADIPRQTENVLDYYTQRWKKLPIHSVAVSPIPGYFGQGFPGLIYLSSMAYLREEDRPMQLRNPSMDAFFSGLLLPHEAAHQWWGNIVAAADYRADWLMEAMANYSALQYLEQKNGITGVQRLFEQYRADLTRDWNGRPVDAAGPVDFGARLIDSANTTVWQTIVYEKGTWVLHMLHERLGDDGFIRMQRRLLDEFATRPMTNEDFRKVASEFVPAGQPDQTLSLFFDTWIYGTGIPKLTLRRERGGATLEMGDVDEDFTVDIPLRCGVKGGGKRTRWVRASSGTNSLDLAAGCELPDADEFLYSR